MAGLCEAGFLPTFPGSQTPTTVFFNGLLDTGERVDVFHPRNMTWDEHFAIRDGYVVGLTPCGRGSARLLDMNNEYCLQHRRQLIEQQEFDAD